MRTSAPATRPASTSTASSNRPPGPSPSPPGAGIRINAGRLVVRSADDVALLDVPSGHVERLVLFGPVGLTAGARTWALANHIYVIIASRRGHYLGQLLTGQHPPRHPPPRAARLRRRPSPRGRLRSRGRGGEDPQTGRPAPAVHPPRTPRPDRRRDHHHARHGRDATRRRYPRRDHRPGRRRPALALLVPEPLRFDGRSRRPPLDVVNAALPFGYTLLLGEAVAALAAAGLDPAIGLPHADADNRPSLALDLTEEFRPLIVDQTVLTTTRARQLTTEHGRTDDNRPGVLLTKQGRTILIDAYERRMLHQSRGALPGHAGSLRRHLHRQAQRVAAHIEHGTAWTGLAWR